MNDGAYSGQNAQCDFIPYCVTGLPQGYTPTVNMADVMNFRYVAWGVAAILFFVVAVNMRGR